MEASARETASAPIGQGLGARYAPDTRTVHLTGIQALARLPMDVARRDRAVGLRTGTFISGYEGSPLGGYDLELLKNEDLLADLGIVFKPGVNEELAATAVQGTQQVATHPARECDGVTAFWYGKSPGLDRASDAIRHANLAGVSRQGGVVAFVGDDPAAKSSTVPGASERLLADLGIPTLFPANPQEVLEYGIHAVEMSRVSGLWTAIKIATNVADGSGTVVVPHELHTITPDPIVDGREYEHSVTSRLLQPNLTPLEESRDGVRRVLSLRYIAANGLNTITQGRKATARLGLVAAGKTYMDLRQALSALGLDDSRLQESEIRLLKLGAIFPLEERIVREFADGLDEIIVIEEKRSFIEAQLKEVLYNSGAHPRILGKLDDTGAVLFPSAGELDVDKILNCIGKKVSEAAGIVAPTSVARKPAQRGHKELPLLPSRTPYFCSGCPHSRSTQVPAGSSVGAGIGCHTLVLGMNPSVFGEIGGLTQMGGEGAQWIGIEPFLTQKHLFQNLGDGTFHHSGSLAIRAAVASNANITYKLLYNSAVAMTGGQQATGKMTIPEISQLLNAEGVRQIIITTHEPHRYRRLRLPSNTRVWSSSRLIEAQERLAEVAGVTVLIHDQECATELRRKRKRGLAPQASEKAFINERICEGCGDCGKKSNCLSVHPVNTDFGRKTQIDQASCNSDLACFEGDCPAFLSISPAVKQRTPQRPMPSLPPNLPEPSLAPLTSDHNTRIMGVGGTGIVTTAQILAAAASAAGLEVVALDQTGLAQKGGAVVSDIRIARDKHARTNKLAAGECDLYLAPDILVAVEATNLEVVNAERTNAVISTSQVPTGAMVSDVNVTFPDEAALKDAISASLPAERIDYLDARSAVVALLGADQYANTFLLGVAYQHGWLPIAADHIRAAVRLNGSQVEKNLLAFEFGRLSVARPDDFQAALSQHVGGTAVVPVHPAAQSVARELMDLVDHDIATLILDRTSELIRYQSKRYARSYVKELMHVHQASHRAGLDGDELVRAVATYLFKLMAYKDEYEVARLSFDPATTSAIREQFGTKAKVRMLLRPPVLSTFGLNKKIKVGRWGRPMMWLLAHLKFLRGTLFDPFGYTEVRRTERALVVEYLGTIRDLCGDLSADNLNIALRLAELPDMVRGYEGVKLDNVRRYHGEREQLMIELVAVQR